MLALFAEAHPRIELVRIEAPVLGDIRQVKVDPVMTHARVEALLARAWVRVWVRVRVEALLAGALHIRGLGPDDSASLAPSLAMGMGGRLLEIPLARQLATLDGLQLDCRPVLFGHGRRYGRREEP